MTRRDGEEECSFKVASWIVLEAQGDRMNALSLPFKGRDGVGMGANGSLIDKIAAR